MKDVTFGVKVPEDLRDEINEIMKASGLVGREFMQELIDSYGLDKSKQEIPEMAEEVKELQQLTHRINEMYLYLGTRFKNIIATKEKEKEDKDAQLSEEKQDYIQKIDQYKSEVKKAKEEMLKYQEELKSANKTKQEILGTIEELRGYNENYKELNDQYKASIQGLTKEVDQLKHLKLSNDKLINERDNLQENNDNLASELWFSKREIERLSETIVKNKEEYNRGRAQLKDQHQLELQTRALEYQLESQKKIEELNNKAAEMQKEYNDKLKELLFSIEKQSAKGEEK